MQEQNRRAVETMCRCGLDLEGVINVFPGFPREEIVAVYRTVGDRDTEADGESSVRINCP